MGGPCGGFGWGDVCRERLGIGIFCVGGPCYVAVELCGFAYAFFMCGSLCVFWCVGRVFLFFVVKFDALFRVYCGVF